MILFVGLGDGNHVISPEIVPFLFSSMEREKKLFPDLFFYDYFFPFFSVRSNDMETMNVTKYITF